MDKLDILEQKVISAVTKISKITAEKNELKQQLDVKSAETEALETEKKRLLRDIEGLKELKTENERLRSGIETTLERVEGIISKIEAAGIDDDAEASGAGGEAEGVADEVEVEEPVADTSEGPGGEREVSESIFDDR